MYGATIKIFTSLFSDVLALGYLQRYACVSTERFLVLMRCAREVVTFTLQPEVLYILVFGNCFPLRTT